MKDFTPASAKQMASALLVGLLSLCLLPDAGATARAAGADPATATAFEEVPCAGVADWSSTQVYTGGQQARLGNTLYRAKWWTRGENPAQKSGQYDVWQAVGPCDGGGGNANVAPTVRISSPSSGASFTAGSNVDVAASAADSDGTIAKVAFFNNGGLVSEDTGAPFSATVRNARAGSYTLTAVATDDDGATTTSSEVRITVTANNPNPNPNPNPPNPPNPPTSGLPSRILNGYWHNFNNGSGITRLRDVSPNWDVINVSFAVPSVSVNEGTIGFKLDGAFNALNYSEADFKSDIRLLQSRGKKVIISIGGAEGQVRLTTAAAATKFTNSMTNIIKEYGFNGMDIDFEGQSLSFDRGDTDFRNPTTPLIVNTINAIRGVTNNFGSDFILTMAPETFFVQLGYSFYGGISTFADARAGSYLPVIHALRDKLTFLQVQYYNSGSITALDGTAYGMGNSDFYVSLVDMLLKGFPITGDASKFFPALRQDQILIGVPATVNAGGGFTGAQGVTTALDYLIRGNSFGGRYTLDRKYPNLRGVMSWSTNWDEFGGLAFSNSVRAYLDRLPAAAPLSARTDVPPTAGSSMNVQVFPNPVAGNSLTIQLDAETDSPDFELQLFNVLGAKVFEYATSTLSQGANTVSVDFGDLASGLYLYHVTTADGQATSELLVR